MLRPVTPPLDKKTWKEVQQEIGSTFVVDSFDIPSKIISSTSRTTNQRKTMSKQLEEQVMHIETAFQATTLYEENRSMCKML